MADVHSRAIRSKNMAAIRGKHTRPEMVVRRALHALGLRYRLHTRLPGKPDLVFPKHRAVLFVHGCFWHRHTCANGRVLPRTRAEFWKEKLEGNAERDRRNRLALKKAGWRVFVIWECEVSAARFSRLASSIRSRARREKQSTAVV